MTIKYSYILFEKALRSLAQQLTCMFHLRSIKQLACRLFFLKNGVIPGMLTSEIKYPKLFLQVSSINEQDTNQPHPENLSLSTNLNKINKLKRNKTVYVDRPSHNLIEAQNKYIIELTKYKVYIYWPA